jgi:rare lipoprotein A
MERTKFVLGSKAFTCAVGIMALLALSSAGGESTRSDDASSKNAGKVTPEVETGVASYYAHKYHGKQTASGETFDMHALTAAHPTYKFGTRVKVTHLENKHSVTVRINDRGPFVKGRVIDLSLAAAKELQMVESGLAQVKLEIVE